MTVVVLGGISFLDAQMLFFRNLLIPLNALTLFLVVSRQRI